MAEVWAEPIDPNRANKRTLLILYGIRVFHKRVNGTGTELDKDLTHVPLRDLASHLDHLVGAGWSEFLP